MMMMMMMMMMELIMALTVFQLRQVSEKEITCVAWPKGRIFSSGWLRQIVMHADRMDMVRPRNYYCCCCCYYYYYYY